MNPSFNPHSNDGNSAERATRASEIMNMTPVELLRIELLSSLRKFTQAMFKAQYNRSFIIAEHHEKMFQA